MGQSPKDMLFGLTADRLRQCLHYDHIYGEFWWLQDRSDKVVPMWKCGASKKDLKQPKRYIYIKVDGHLYFAHRLAWLHYYGEWPERFIDHINGNKRDNCIANLREASAVQNNQNRAVGRYNTSGCKGVSWDKKLKGWRVTIIINYRKIYVGCSQSLPKAVEMRQAAEEKYFGSFARAA